MQLTAALIIDLMEAKKLFISDKMHHRDDFWIMI